MTQVKQATEQDQLTDIESLYANAIKLLKHLREPGIIRHVETRREYQLKATKLNYRPVELKKLDFIQLELHANYRYEIVSEDKAYQFIGRFNPDGKVQVKVPAKWASAKSWQLNAQAVEDDFVAKIFPKLVNPTWTLQDRNNAVMVLASGGLIGGVTGYLYGDQIKETVLENLPRITGAAQVASGIMSLYVAGVVGVTGVGAPLAAAIGFVALDNIQAGARSMWTNEHTPTYGGELIEWSGLLPKGYGEIAYSLVDIGLVGKAASVLKTATQTQNVIKLQTTKAVKVGQTIKPTEVTISVEKITLNQKNVIELKEFKINLGQQNKHILGTNEYKTAAATADNQRSLLIEDSQSLLSKLGTGQQIGKIEVGLPGSKERIDFGKVIGYFADKDTGLSIPTNKGIVHYGKNGVHIVPSRP